MAAYYVVVDVQIDDPEEYKKYMELAKPLAEKHGGEYLVRGGDLTVYEGDYYQPRRTVLLRYPSKQDFEAFYNSPEYQVAREIRLPAGDMIMIGVEGFEG